MKISILKWGVAGLLVAAFALVVLQVGCEDADDTVALTVEPNYVDLTSTTSSASTGTQTFTVTDGLRDLSLPLVWSVSDPSMGTIADSGGTTASYVRSNRTGDNSILVEDQYGARGVATVRQ